MKLDALDLRELQVIAEEHGQVVNRRAPLSLVTASALVRSGTTSALLAFPSRIRRRSGINAGSIGTRRTPLRVFGGFTFSSERRRTTSSSSSPPVECQYERDALARIALRSGLCMPSR